MPYRSGYQAFSAVVRSTAPPDLSFSDMAKWIAAEWKQLSPEDKASYNALAVPGQPRRPRRKPKIAGPKPPLTAYMCYVSRNNSMPTTVLARQWANMDAEQRVVYDELAAKDRERYAAEKAEMPSVVPKRDKKKAVKRPLPPYIRFCCAVRAKVRADHPELPMSEIAKRMGVMWNEMTVEEKAVYSS